MDVRAQPGKLSRAAGKDLIAFAKREIAGESDTPAPAALSYIWNWYRQVSVFRPDAMSGVPYVRPESIEAWARLRHVPVRAFEFDLLLAIDAEFVAFHTERLKQGSRISGKKPELLRYALRGAEPTARATPSPRKSKKPAKH